MHLLVELRALKDTTYRFHVREEKKIAPLHSLISIVSLETIPTKNFSLAILPVSVPLRTPKIVLVATAGINYQKLSTAHCALPT